MDDPLRSALKSGHPLRPEPLSPAPNPPPEYQGEPDELSSSSATSLDPQETSVRGDFDAFMARKGTAEDWGRTATLDDTSLSSNFRHSGWQHIRRRIFKALESTGQSQSRRLAFGECGSYSWIEQNNANSSQFRVRYNHCHDRLCTPCANARSRELSAALLTLIGESNVSFITLTLCGKGESLSELVDRLYKHFRALRQHPLWAERVSGGAAFLEIKYSDKAKRWHPHLHIIAEARFIDQGELSTVWRTISRDSFIVDIRRVRDRGTVTSYVTKYASKPLNSSFSADQSLLAEAILALRGRRLCLCFGSWYGTALTDIEDADTLPEEDAGWHMFCDLESILDRASHGIADAIAVIKLAGIESLWRASLTPARAPP